MNSNPASLRLSISELLCFTLNLSASEAASVIEKRSSISAQIISDRSHLERAVVDRLLQNPSTVKQLHLNPNRITTSQIARIPYLKAERSKIVAQGQPYYAIAELEAATALPRALLDQLFVIAPFSYEDKQAQAQNKQSQNKQIQNKQITFTPVSGRYLIPAKTDLEATDPLEATGYVEMATSPLGLPSNLMANLPSEFEFRIVQPSELEADPAPHLLKATFAGNVHPVLRDAEGFERYLVPGSLDLWFRPDVAESHCREIIQTLGLPLGLQVINATPKVGYYRVKLMAIPIDRDVVRAVLAIINQAQQLDEIRFAEVDQVGFEDFGADQSVIANDQEFEADDRFWNYAAIQLPEAHLITKGSPNVTIMIVDSGARIDHEALQPTLRPDWQTLDLNFDLGVIDSERSPNELVIAHGTKVAGIIAIAPNCRILPIKISGQFASPAYGLRAAAIVQALTYLQPQERAVINLSWRTNGEHIGIREALVDAKNRGVAVVTSAGNYDSGAAQQPDELHYPSAHTYRYPQLTNLCTVAAVAIGDRKASYSYYGAQSITVAAPGGENGSAGVGIYTTSTPEKYVYTCGTSFAAPHVAGLIALLFSVKPDLSAAEAIALIKETADSINPNNAAYVGMLGAGRINAKKALDRLISSPNPSDVSVPKPITEPIKPSHYDSLGRLNINLATLAELMTLPAIGAWLGDRIIKYRAAHGLFNSIWGLSLAGVSAWTIGQIKSKITI